MTCFLSKLETQFKDSRTLLLVCGIECDEVRSHWSLWGQNLNVISVNTYIMNSVTLLRHVSKNDKRMLNSKSAHQITIGCPKPPAPAKNTKRKCTCVAKEKIKIKHNRRILGSWAPKHRKPNISKISNAEGEDPNTRKPSHTRQQLQARPRKTQKVRRASFAREKVERVRRKNRDTTNSVEARREDADRRKQWRRRRRRPVQQTRGITSHEQRHINDVTRGNDVTEAHLDGYDLRVTKSSAT